MEAKKSSIATDEINKIRATDLYFDLYTKVQLHGLKSFLNVVIRVLFDEYGSDRQHAQTLIQLFQVFKTIYTPDTKKQQTKEGL